MRIASGPGHRCASVLRVHAMLMRAGGKYQWFVLRAPVGTYEQRTRPDTFDRAASATVEFEPPRGRREELLAARATVPRLPQAGKAFQRLHGQELRRRPHPVRPVSDRPDWAMGRGEGWRQRG